MKSAPDYQTSMLAMTLSVISCSTLQHSSPHEGTYKLPVSSGVCPVLNI